jgi:gamma-glutamyl:cysteine ligase YbdK (ATP-grasp superfamily)
MKVLRAAVAAKDARSPGYLAAVEAAATGGDETHYDVPRNAYLAIVREHGGRVLRPARRPRIAVGDTVERMLTSVGITKELVQRLTRTKDCGCKARQQWLNQWGYRQQDRMERLLNRAARWYGIS